MSSQETLNVNFADDNTQEGTLLEVVAQEGELKQWLVNYVGEKSSTTDDNVTVDNIVQVLAEEFPEFLMAVAEENWVRGYKQGISDVEEGMKLVKSEEDLENESL